MRKWSWIRKEKGRDPWEYGDIVCLRDTGEGRWMLLGNIVTRTLPAIGDQIAAVCLEPPSSSWAEGVVDGVWIDRMRMVE